MLGSLIEHENEVQGIIPQPQIFPLCALEKNVSSLRSLAPVITFNLCANKIQKAIANRPVHADKFYMSFKKKRFKHGRIRLHGSICNFSGLREERVNTKSTFYMYARINISFAV